MSGRDHHGMGRRRRTAVALLACALVSIAGLAAVAEAKTKAKKKSKKVTAVTKSATVPLAAGAATSATAACTGKTHITGGGLAVSPNFTPPATGLRSVPMTSSAAGAKSWTAAAGAFNTPAASGSLTTYARCEGNSAGQLVSTISSAATINPGFGSTATLNCAPGTHVISGGYAGTGIVNFANPTTGYRIVILASRRTGAGQWTVTAYNSSQALTAATVTAYATCERNGKGRAVSEAASPSAPITLSARASADATCAKKAHVVSGGFLVTPNGAGTVPGVAVDETLPVGRRGWHTALFNLSIPPAGSALQTFAYCKKG